VQTRVLPLSLITVLLSGCFWSSESVSAPGKPNTPSAPAGPQHSAPSANGRTTSPNAATLARSLPPAAESPDAMLLERSYPGRTLAVASLPDEQFISRALSGGAVLCAILYQSTGETRGKFDEKKFRANVRRVVPEQQGAMALLDFEGSWMKFLEDEDVTSEAFRAGEAAYLDLLRIAREERPRARWSVYGVPAMRYFGSSTRGTTIAWDKATNESRERGFEKGRRAQRLIDACDWVGPTIYDPYLDSRNPTNRRAGQAHVYDKVALSVEMAKGKPVMPLVWHRVHDTNKTDGLTLLSNEEFVDGQIRPALAAGAAGVVWWGSDSFSTRNGTLQERRITEFEGIREGDAEAMKLRLRELHLEKLRAIEPVLR